MTPAQFECCVTNASGVSSEAARLVLVMDESVARASQLTGITEHAVRKACSRIRKRDAAIRAAYIGPARPDQKTLDATAPATRTIARTP